MPLLTIFKVSTRDSYLAAHLRWLTSLLLLTIVAFAILATNASAADTLKKSASKFNHNNTGYILSDAHAQASCESCHTQGVFKGTPKKCESCHVQGGRASSTAKPSRHIPTNLSCDTCHKTNNWANATFSHTVVAPGSCATCHNVSTGQQAKPAQHIQTNASCDNCHKVSAWLPANRFNHSSVSAGSCATCHNGSKATGKTSNHIST
ncbi:MAG: cytochrome c3 family protein, partial [Methylophilaceae bacterium]